MLFACERHGFITEIGHRRLYEMLTYNGAMNNWEAQKKKKKKKKEEKRGTEYTKNEQK